MPAQMGIGPAAMPSSPPGWHQVTWLRTGVTGKFRHAHGDGKTNFIGSVDQDIFADMVKRLGGLYQGLLMAKVG